MNQPIMSTLHYNTMHLLHLLFLLLLISPSSSSSLDPMDLKALLSIKNTLTEVSSTKPFFSTWNLTARDPCSSFSGVTCFLSRVSILSLGTASLQLAGFLPTDSISLLTDLTQLILSPGIVTGPIPPQLARLTKLRVISLPSNRFTGTLPSLSSLHNLHTLDLSHNQLAGSLPPSLTELPQLKVLILASNTLAGPIPRAVKSPLLHLDLKNNQLTGPLPLTLPSSLRYLSLSQNLMWGPLTNGSFETETLKELVFLDLSMNRFTGPIPAQLFSLPALSNVFLQRNYLSGGLGLGLGSGPRPGPKPGSIVDLSHNALGGELSEVLEGVESLFLNNNRFVGRVPEVYVKSVCRGSTRTLYLQHNFLTGIPMLREGTVVPDTAALCLSYNCMVPPATMVMTCPASAGGVSARPEVQCPVFNHRSSNDNNNNGN